MGQVFFRGTVGDCWDELLALLTVPVSDYSSQSHGLVKGCLLDVLPVNNADLDMTCKVYRKTFIHHHEYFKHLSAGNREFDWPSCAIGAS